MFGKKRRPVRPVESRTESEREARGPEAVVPAAVTGLLSLRLTLVPKKPPADGTSS